MKYKSMNVTMKKVLLLLLSFSYAVPLYGQKPNVILILTDDQGYGEIAAHGNPVIKTPQMDKLHATSVRLTDFHVDLTCSPTRSALLTGRYSTRTGGRHILKRQWTLENAA